SLYRYLCPERQKGIMTILMLRNRQDTLFATLPRELMTNYLVPYVASRLIVYFSPEKERLAFLEGKIWRMEQAAAARPSKRARSSDDT
ncbi:MAG: hypothetical protein ACMG6E_00870, partial [Candidatus Roizmanbacteria bacterium]